MSLITVRKVYSIERKQKEYDCTSLVTTSRNYQIISIQSHETLKENKSMFCGISQSNPGASKKIKGVVPQLFQQELKLNKNLSQKSCLLSFANFKERAVCCGH